MLGAGPGAAGSSDAASGWDFKTVVPASGPPFASRSRFRILRPHARGGLGEVYVAMDEELGRQVALKEIRAHHTDNPVLRSRFVREAEINGNLEHPSIVPVYGLGTYPDGRPFYAMRFIQGDSLKSAIERFHEESPGLSATDRALRLRHLLGRFVDVCEAVAYAHSRGVLHRDLKPANVMLGKYGETLVVDWGLAKAVGASYESSWPGEAVDESLLTPRSGDSSDATVAGSALGTPGFMSPEQAEGRVDSLDARTDVYSLGATLYCLLTGKPPLAGADALCKTSTGDVPPPRTLNRHVPRVLEAVCLKAMAVDPAGRYPSVKALAEDVERWLADEAVLGVTEPWSDGLRRWTRRHRTLVTAAAAVAFVLAANLLLLAWVRVKHVEREAKLAAQSAEREAKLAAQSAADQATAREKERASKMLTDFVVSLFQSTDPLGLENRGFATSEERMNMISALTLLEAGAKGLDPPGEPGQRGDLVGATLRDTIGNSLRAVGDARRARPLLLEAYQVRRSALPPDHRDVVLSEFHLAMLNHFSGKLEAADEIYARAETKMRNAGRADDDLLDRIEFHHAWALAEMKKGSEAAAMIDRVFERRRRLRGEEHNETKLARFAGQLIKLGAGDRGVLIKEITRSGLAGDPIAKALFQYIVADAVRKRADQTRNPAEVEDARRKLEDVLALARANLPPRHFLIGYLLGDMAEFERNHGNFPRAVALIQEGFEIGRQTFPTHPRFIDALVRYAEEMEKRRQYDEAEKALTEALDAVIQRDDRERQAALFQDYLGRLLRLPKYRDDKARAEALRKKYQ
ncbi:MAG: serine/threonine-protein kinase [Isosphaeraceae bacterium]